MLHKLSLLLVALTVTLRACLPEDTTVIEMEINPGVDTILIGETHDDAGATAQVGERTISVTVLENTVDSDTPGVYEIVYRARYNGITTTIVRKVEVVDERPLSLALRPGVDTVLVGTSWTDAGVDVLSNDENVSIETVGHVDTDAVGVYVITYIVTDALGNEDRLTRKVHVIDNAE